MEKRTIQVTAYQLEKLIAEVHALPRKPVGDHLLEEDFIDYAAEMLSSGEVEHIDAHLASCAECAIKMEPLLEASEGWRGEKGEQRLAELAERARVGMSVQPTGRLQEIAAFFQRLLQSRRGEGKQSGAHTPSERTPISAGSAQYEIICDIARDILTKLVPHELAFFPLISEAFFRNPQAVFAGGGYKEDMLGFGLETDEVLLTPAALAVVSDAVRFGRERVPDSIKMCLGAEQLDQIHKRAFETACRLRLSETQARALADALVENLKA